MVTRRPLTLLAALATGVLLLAGCSQGGPKDSLQSAPTLSAARPATSPAADTRPAGTVLPMGGQARGLTIDARTHTLAVATSRPSRLLLYSLTDLRAGPRTVRLPAAPAHVSLAAPGGPLLVAVPSAHRLLRVDPRSGRSRAVRVPGKPTDAVRFGDRTLVTVPDRRALLVLRGGRVVQTITGSVSPQQVLIVHGHPVILDRLRSAVFDVDLAGGQFGAGLRAGQGAATAVADSFGRVLVTDARTGALLAFSVDPVFKRQLFPVPGTPYGLAYSPRHHLAWVTLTARNQLVAYDVAGGEPVEKRRLPTIRQPNEVAVDAESGTVVVASGAGKGIQVVRR